MTRIRTNSGKNLKRVWNIPAVQVRYHKDGTFFMPLNENAGEFPAALIDPDGYILFQTLESYVTNDHVSIGERINVYKGISNIPGYKNMKEKQKDDLEIPAQENQGEFFSSDIQDAENPNQRETVIRRHIRDTATARSVKQLHNDKCQICGLALPIASETYSEAHHIQPLGEPHNGPDIPSNILVLCPNHHAQCDFGGIELNLESLHQVPGHVVEEKYIQYHNKEIVQTKPAQQCLHADGRGLLPRR